MCGKNLSFPTETWPWLRTVLRGTMYDACDVERVYFSRWRAILASADDDWGDPRVFGRRIWGAAERGLVVREKKVENMKIRRVGEDGSEARHAK